MTISDREMAALVNLADKQAGKDVGWINIADARALTDLGLARRSRGGWDITPEGLGLIKAQTGGPMLVAHSEVVGFQTRPESANEGD